MPEKSGSLADWKSHVEDYILVRGKINTQSVTMRDHHLIVNFAKRLHIIIEDDKINEVLAQEMIVAGVKVVTMKEYWKLSSPHIFSDDRVLDELYRRQFGTDED